MKIVKRKLEKLFIMEKCFWGYSKSYKDLKEHKKIITL